MTRNFKRYMRNAAGIASLANGYWAFQMQNGNDQNNWLSVFGAMLSAWLCYFCVVWLVEGLRSK